MEKELNNYVEHLHLQEQNGTRNLNYGAVPHIVENLNLNHSFVAYSHVANYFLAYCRNYYPHEENWYNFHLNFG
jgi:hypothetical protein